MFFPEIHIILFSVSNSKKIYITENGLFKVQFCFLYFSPVFLSTRSLATSYQTRQV